MDTKNTTQIVKDLKEKSIIVSRDFNAPLEKVWKSYTDSDILRKWWAPPPWKVETKVMNFNIGGYWLYAMVSPEGEKHWGKVNYIAIDYHKSYNLEDAFCDENGNINKDLHSSKGQVSFSLGENGTFVEFKMIYNTEKDLYNHVEMGFEQGISMTFDSLDNLFIQNKI